MCSLITYFKIKYVVYQFKPNEPSYSPSKHDTSLLIQTSTNEITAKDESQFGNNTLYELFCSGLNVITERGGNEFELPQTPNKDNNQGQLIKHGM